MVTFASDPASQNAEWRRKIKVVWFWPNNISLPNVENRTKIRQRTVKILWTNIVRLSVTRESDTDPYHYQHANSSMHASKRPRARLVSGGSRTNIKHEGARLTTLPDQRSVNSLVIVGWKPFTLYRNDFGVPKVNLSRITLAINPNQSGPNLADIHRSRGDNAQKILGAIG